MATDISGLNNKKANGGDAPDGVLLPTEWNQLVNAVIENQDRVAKSITGIVLNGVKYNNPDSDGLIEVELKEGDYIVEINPIETPASIITKGESCKVKFTITNRSKKSYTDDNPNGSPHNWPATARFYWGNDLVGTINNIYDREFTNPDNLPNVIKEVEFDYSKVVTLSTSSDGNILRWEIDNNEGGEDSKASDRCIVRVIDASISASLTGGINNKLIFNEDNTPHLTVSMSGEDGLLNVSINNNLVVDQKEIQQNAVYDDFDNIFIPYLTHGSHKIDIVAVPKNFPNISISIPSIEYIYGDTNAEDPLITTNIRENDEFEVYTDININYIAFWANATSTSLFIDLKKDGTSILGNAIEIPNIEFVNGVLEGTYKLSLFPQDGASVDTITGDLVLEVTLGNNTISTNIKVTKTSDITFRPLANWDVLLSARDKDAINANRKWECTNSKNVTYSANFNGVEFIDNGSGFNNDEDGYKAMRLKKGKSFELNYQPFKVNPTYSGDVESATPGTGKTISIEFAARNCLDLDSEVISCIDPETGVGFKITANQVQLISNGITNPLTCNFNENERIRVDITIDGKPERYKYFTYKGTGSGKFPGESYEALAIIYINGVYQRLTLIKSGTSYQQTNPQYIKFGSDKCDLDVYNVRIYNSSVYMNDIINNYAADTPDSKNAISLMIRNDIFSKTGNPSIDPSTDTTVGGHLPVIDLGKLINTARPDLPIMYFTMDPSYEDVLPMDKDSWRSLINTRWYNPHSKDTISDGNSSWETRHGAFRNQGTSSMNYPWPWRNWDFKLDKYKDEADGKEKKGYFEIPRLGSSNKPNKWIQYDGMPEGISKITLKKDYASSEMCNNAICSEIFTDMAVGVCNFTGQTTNLMNVLSPAMKNNGGASTNYRLTFKATPCFAIQLLNDGQNTQYPMGMMNLIPNKNEVGYLGFKSPYTWEESSSQSWECAENHVNWDKLYFTVLAKDDRRTPEQGGPIEGNKGFGYYGEVDVKVKDENGNPVLDNEGNFTYTKEYKYLGNYINGLDGNYEARYPKDSTIGYEDFGFATKDTLSDEEFAALYREQTDILDFHNWLVKTNRFGATDKELTRLYNEDFYGMLGSYEIEDWNLELGGGIVPKYTTDTQEYRLTKFEKESPYRLIKEQWILYYIWREQFWMFDSGSKNLQMYTMGKNPSHPDQANAPMQWGCMVRDADTALGINNVGVDMFPPHLEDIDSYSVNADGSVKFHYGAAEGKFNSTQLAEGQRQVLNGQFGSIWLNIRDCWSGEIEEVYKALSTNANKTNFSADKAIERFDKHQDNWSEALYNWGMRQYFGGTPFSSQISSGNGNKKSSRKNWLEKGFYYRNSKYNNLSDYISWRCNLYNTNDYIAKRELNIKTYIPMYIATGGSTTSMAADGFNRFRITDPTEGINVPTGALGFNFKEVSDSNTFLFGSDNITDLGDLARFVKMDSQGQGNAMQIGRVLPKLTSLKLGHHVDPNKPGHEVPYTELNDNGESVVLTNNTALSLTLNNLPALTYLDITNHVALTNLVMDKCTQTEELYMSGTDRLSAFNFPKTTTLREVHLGAGLTRLDIEDLTGIEVFDWDRDYVSNAQEGETLEKPGMKKLTMLKIVNCGDLLKGNTSYNIVKEAIDSLTTSYKRGENIDQSSKTNCIIYDVNWTGVTEEMINKLLDINADITGTIVLDKLTYNTKMRLLSKYKSIDNDTDKLYVTYPEVDLGTLSMAEDTFIQETGRHQLKFIPRNTNGNNFISMSWSIENNSYAEFKKDDIEKGILTVNKIGTEEDAPRYMVTVTVNLKNGRSTSVSGYVNFYTRSCKIGDYVFQDGSFLNTIPEGKIPIGVCFYIDPQNPENRLMAALKCITPNSLTWGLNTWQNNSEGGINNVELNSDPDYNCYDIKKITNISNSGVIDTDANYNAINNLIDSEYRNGPESNHRFTIYSEQNAYGDLGWREISNSIDIEEDNIHYEAQSHIPIGLYKTLCIIEHRNKILNDFNLEIPTATERTSEYNKLNQLLDQYGSADKANGTQEYLYYYPAASSCYSYEPSVDNLDDRFKKHTWWLPAAGEILRLLYYLKNSGNEFDQVKSDKVFDISEFMSSEYNRLISSTESGRDQCCNVRWSSRASFENKTYANSSTNARLLPINKF